MVSWAPRQRLLYGAVRAAPLLTAAADVQDLEVRHRGHVLSSPHLMEIILTSKGRRDIPSSAFDSGRPLALDVGASIVEVLEIVCEPESSPTPPITYDGTTLWLGPELIGRRETISVSLLIDGSHPRLRCKEATIAQVSVLRRDLELARRRRSMILVSSGASILVATGIVMATYLLTQAHTTPPAAAPNEAESIIINQPLGDRQTIFVIHGRGWTPGSRVATSLNGRKSRTMSAVDFAGTFNYAINQVHGFFSGPIPPGDYTATATAANGRRAQVMFSVHG
jgi:hypothetical protein